ncbi:MAG: SDR family NAD(P)-dependent oxidoreductase, partial [Bacteroidales bacterium]|nr:SDR family NAD(P)-dependent oxidoreductase [Bacteroidales bacterium]
MDCSKRWALVSGASSGIGWQISVQLAMRGCNIVGVSNQPAQLDDLKNNLERSHSVKVVTMTQDLGM